MFIDYSKRKSLLANARKAISEDEWYCYLETCYPKWWKSVYGDKWRINIIYYGKNDGHADEYPMYINKNYTMHKIMVKFHRQLLFQKSAIKMCFGSDISGNIIKHLPENNFCPENNYIYVHNRQSNIDGSMNFTRYCVPNNRKLIHLCGDLAHQDTTNLNLRIRKNPKQLTSRDFSKVFAYG
tara:strand:+ start:18695 stop:19240 length:546 start_codon:yes stop_codon:yes gene_type:complete